MIPRQLTSTLLKRLRQMPAVALLGSRLHLHIHT